MPKQNSENLKNIIAKLPKCDLHVHLDGSVRVETLIDLSKKYGLSLPSYSAEGLNELVFKDEYKSLDEYLAGFKYILPILQIPESLERVSYEFAWDNINEGVFYVEVKFAPQLHINEKQNMERILLSVNKGLNRAKTEYNQKPEVRTGLKPEFNYGIITCIVRAFSKGQSKYFDEFIDKYKTKSHNEIYALAAYELIKDCVKVRDEYDIPIVACDLVGSEAGNPPKYFKKAYHLAHSNLMHLIVHAGEAYGPESIHQAIAELYPERIGHGTSLFSVDQITDPAIKDKEQFSRKLIQYIAERRITIEVCLTSNFQTLPIIKKIKDHPLVKMLAADLSLAICTDNRTFSKTNVTRELMLAVESFSLTKIHLKKLILDSFVHSFMPIEYLAKKKYIAKIEDICDQIMSE
jgi:adenosine deaminase